MNTDDWDSAFEQRVGRITTHPTEKLLEADLSALKAHRNRVMDYCRKVDEALIYRLEYKWHPNITQNEEDD